MGPWLDTGRDEGNTHTHRQDGNKQALMFTADRNLEMQAKANTHMHTRFLQKTVEIRMHEVHIRHAMCQKQVHIQAH